MKNTDMLEWMTDLDARFLAEAAQPAVKVTHKRRRTALTLIAAAAAVVCTTAGVSAAISRNTDLLTTWFGNGAEGSFAALPAPKAYENGQVRVTVETEFDDGISHLLLLSFSTPDGEPYDFPMYDWRDAEGRPIKMQNRPEFFGYDAHVNAYGTIGDFREFGFVWDEPDSVPVPEEQVTEYRNGKYFALRLTAEALGGGICTLKLALSNDYDARKYPDNPEKNIFAGIEIPVRCQQTVECPEFRAANGDFCRLSCFELTGLDADAANTEELGWSTESGIVLVMQDGTRKALSWRDTHGAGGAYLEPGVAYEIPLAFYIDPSKVAAIELGGVRYEKE